METLWFCLVALMLALYVVFDGFDIGVGIVHLLVAKTDAERRVTLRSIGPVWDGNEVWLIAAGGTLYFAFPALYAASFSGFYLPLMIVLWLLILRGISIELRNHLEGPVWITLKTRDAIRERARKLAVLAWWGVAGLTAVITLFSLRLQPQILSNLAGRPWGCVFPAAALLGLIGAYRFHRARREVKAFLSSCAYLAGMIASAAFGIYPNVLPAVTGPARALTIANAAAPEHGLRIGLVWWTVGVVLAIGYVLFSYSRFAGKVTPETEGY